MTSTSARLRVAPRSWAEAGHAPGAAALPALAGRAGARRITARRLHTWAGLSAAAWLSVLAVTGFLLDHREWRWMWQATVPEALVTQSVVDSASHGAARLYRINPRDPRQRLSGGPQGLWWSEDGGGHWQRCRFAGMDGAPQVFEIVADPRRGWERLWLATDAGVWLAADQGRTARPAALPGESIGALAAGAAPDELIGVADRSRVFRLRAEARRLEWLALAAPPPAELPPAIDLRRLVYDLHFGRGLFAGLGSLVVNDLGALALLVLPVSGVLFWWLPRRWRAAAAHRRTASRTKKRTVRWLFRAHAPVLGVAAVVPIAYLSVTGILLDHSDALRPWLSRVAIGAHWQPPTYRLRSWADQIYGVAGYPGAPGRLSLGTRLGLFTSADDGRSWKREAGGAAAPGFVWTLRRHGATLAIGGMGSPNLIKEGDGPWRIVKDAGHMPSDVSPDGRGGWVWKSGHGLKGGSDAAGFAPVEQEVPRLAGVPWFYVLDGLHSGALIHPQWKWVNDLFALLAVVLIATGVPRWWRKKWA